MRSQRIVWTLSICLLFATSSRALGQSSRSPGGAPGKTGAAASTDADEIQHQLARDLAKKANLERQALLKADTEKLLKLSQELKEYVDKSSADILSLEVLKKAEEIEKLAHTVKEKMKGPN